MAFLKLKVFLTLSEKVGSLDVSEEILPNTNLRVVVF